jgi:hypothetical protein
MPIGTEERRDDVNLYLPGQRGVINRAAFLCIDVLYKNIFIYPVVLIDFTPDASGD